MPSLRRPSGAGLIFLLSLGFVGCSGNSGSGVQATATGGVQVRVSPASLSLPAGTASTVTLTAARHVIPDYPGALTVTVQGLPAGVQASGTVAAGTRTGSLRIWVDGTVAPQTLAHLRVVASGNGVSASTPFALTILAPLPVGAITPDGVQASGRAQAGGAFANTPVAQEPVAATQATDSVQVVGVRHGFLPDTPSN